MVTRLEYPFTATVAPHSFYQGGDDGGYDDVRIGGETRPGQTGRYGDRRRTMGGAYVPQGGMGGGSTSSSWGGQTGLGGGASGGGFQQQQRQQQQRPAGGGYQRDHNGDERRQTGGGHRYAARPTPPPGAPGSYVQRDYGNGVY